MEQKDLQRLNDDLLKPAPTQDEEQAAKRNSKEDLVSKIVKCCEDSELELPFSDTKLRRMTKQQLMKLLAECLEQRVRNEMAAQVGAKKGASDGTIALGALKMIHSIAANTAEKTLNIFLPKYGYEVEGFSDSLKNPAVDQAVNACLEEIAADSDILQYVESPYTRLAIAWAGALVTSIKKTKPIRNRYATRLGPTAPNSENSFQSRVGGGSKDGQEQRRVRFGREDEKEV